MKTSSPSKRDAATSERLLFRLDFALRGHGAYIDPADLESLIAQLEAASRLLGAPLLRYLASLPEVAEK